MKDWSDSTHDWKQGSTLLGYIVREFEICGLPKAHLFIEHLLETGRCLILLDGLDEITQKQNEAIGEIQLFTEKYDQCRFVISCRLAANNFVSERFKDAEVTDFDDEQIGQFIGNFFGDDANTAYACWEKLNAHPPIKELASVPLLLTLLCIAFDAAYDFPTNRADLYREAIEALLQKWDASRRIRRGRVYENMTRRRKEALLGRLAYATFTEGHYYLPQRVVERSIADYIQHLPEVDDASLLPTSTAILHAIEAQHGLLIQRAKGVYSFSHLTVQEYFTARHIVEHRWAGLLEKLIDEHWQEEGWHEVIQLALGMTDDATEMVYRLRKLLSTDAADRGLVDMLQEIATIEFSDAPYSSEIMRCLVIGSFYQSANFHAISVTRTRVGARVRKRAQARAHASLRARRY